MSIPLPASSARIKNYRIVISLLLGTIFGLALYSYKLIDFLPPTSKRILSFAALTGLFGAAGYFALFEFWIAPRFAEVKKSLRWGFIGLSIVLGLFLMFAGTSAWKSLSRYVTFLLPNHTLIISAQPTADADVVILFVKTSIGEVSYDSIHFRGWKRDGDRLVLHDLADNELTWTGKVGAEAEIVFQRSPQGGAVNVTWDGMMETVDLSFSKEDKYVYRRDFDVPFHASRELALTLVAVNFIVLSLAASLFVWHKRTILRDQFDRLTLPYGIAGSNVESRLGGIDWFLLLGLIVLALLLRVFNLEDLLPYTDEYAHLLAAKEWLAGAPLTSLYQRSLVTVTLPVALFLKIFGMHIWAARLAGIFFNVLAILPLYWIVHRINRPVAVMTGFLFATNPWIIATARNVREYTYYPFYFYWIVYGMLVFLQRFPDQYVFLRDWKKLLTPRIYFLAFLLLLPVIYLAIDHFSTFKVMLINYGVFLFFLLKKFDLKNKSNLWFFGLAGAVALIGLYLFSPIEGNYSFLPTFDAYLLKYFFPNPPQQWYFEGWLMVPAIVSVCAVILSIALYRRNMIPSFILALFAASVFCFAFFFSRNFRPRYLFNLEFWFIPLIAVGGYGLWILAKASFPNRNSFPTLAVAAIAFLSFNPGQVILPSLYATHGLHPITDEYHDDMRAVDAHLRADVQPGDALVASMYDNYVQWTGAPQFSAAYEYDYFENNGRDTIYNAIAENNSGWIVLDLRRYLYSRPLPRENFVHAGRQVEYVGAFADQLVWQWRVIAEPSQ